MLRQSKTAYQLVQKISAQSGKDFGPTRLKISKSLAFRSVSSTRKWLCFKVLLSATEKVVSLLHYW